MPSAYKKTTLTVSGTNEKVKFKSSNKKVASVSSKGVVTAKKAGKAVIMAYLAQYPEISVLCQITVKNPELKVSTASITVKKGKKVSITATAIPEGKVTFTSANQKIATVSSKGVVKGKKKGSTTVTVSANGVSKKVKVKVTK